MGVGVLEQPADVLVIRGTGVWASRQSHVGFFLFLKLHILNVRGNVPDIAERVLHARYTVAIGLVRGFRQRGGACLEGALVNGVYIVHVQVDRCWHWLPIPGTRTADHHYRVTYPDFSMYTARGPCATEKLCCRERLFHKIDQFSCLPD